MLPELISAKGFPGSLLGNDLAFELVYKSMYLSIYPNENEIKEKFVSEIWNWN